ncbi:MAG: T9SS type A sorting domain-containing protein [Ignavibacteriaceae bacterium]
MAKIYIFYFSFIMAILISTIAIGQVVVFEDNFETYTSGQQIACQSAGIWKTWTNNPCSIVEDAYISEAYSFSGINSLVLLQNNDIVKEIGTPISNGIAEINFQVFIPAGKSGYFNTLTSFAPPSYAWAMQVFLNPNGTGTIDAQGANSASFTFPQNQWFPIKIVADLTADSGKFYINGNLIRRWQWSKGTFGSSNDKRLDGNDFFGYAATDEMYIDNYNIIQIPSATNKIISTALGGNWNDGNTWVGGSVPENNRVVEIVAGATVTLIANVTNRNANTIVNGTLVSGNYSIGGSGNFLLGGGATLQIGAANGISGSGATGNILMSGSRNFSPYATYIYNGISAQVTGSGLPSNINSLTINNTNGVTLSSSISVSNLNLINGNLVTGSNSISVGTSKTNIGILNTTNGKILGNLNRWLSNSTANIFPVGPITTEYTPVILNNVVGSGTFSVSAVDGIHPNATGPDFLQMYWKLTNGGITSADVEFHYLQSDVVGDEESYELYKYNGSWLPVSPFNLNTTTNTASINGVTSFSDWTLGIDNPLPVELSSFTASVIGKSVKLKWQTATEINNYGFDVEKKLNTYEQTSDSWEKIGFVNGNGNSNSAKSYTFVDENIIHGSYSYRLKQIDNDGKYEFSHSVNIDLGKPSEFILEQNYPNPFNPSTTIKFSLPEAAKIKITVFNLLGQEIAVLVDELKESGVHSVEFDASHLNSGIYIYRIESNSFIQTRKMTLIK